MKKLKLLTILFSLFFYAASLSVQAAESIETVGFTENDTNNSNYEITPRALITATNVLKWSEKNIFQVQADIVTNDGTGKIIDIKNIQLRMHTDKAKEISLSRGEIWELKQLFKYSHFIIQGYLKIM